MATATKQSYLQQEAKLESEAATLSAELVALSRAAKAAGRDLTDEEADQADAIIARRSEIEGEQAKVSASRARHEAMLREELKTGQAVLTSNVTDLSAHKPWGADFGADKILAKSDATPRQRQWALRVALGDQAMAAYNAAYGDSIAKARLMAALGDGQNETIGVDGGYLVGEDVSTELSLRTMDGPIRSRVSERAVGPGVNGGRINYLSENSRADGSRFGGISMSWVEEAGTKDVTKAAFAFISWRLKKVAGIIRSTDELLQDVVGLGDYLMTIGTAATRWSIEKAIWDGDGVAKPLGFANAANPALITVAATTQDAGSLVYENVRDMWARLYPPSRPNAVWFVNSSLEALMPEMTITIGTGGQLVYMPAGGISQTGFGSLYGRPVIPVEYAAAPGTVGDIVLADLSQYYFWQKGGIQTASSIHVYFATDETAFRLVARVDGAPAWSAPLTPYTNGTITQSPFVALAAR